MTQDKDVCMCGSKMGEGLCAHGGCVPMHDHYNTPAAPDAEALTALNDIKAMIDPDEWSEGDYEDAKANFKILETALQSQAPSVDDAERDNALHYIKSQEHFITKHIREHGPEDDFDRHQRSALQLFRALLSGTAKKVD